MLDLLYGQVARWRRHAFERQPERRWRLARPVISIGNLSVGGTGKTPVVAAVAQWLLDHGERPAILSRGYRRTEPTPGVVVVSDGQGGLASLGRSGDEPLMLAHAVPGAVICVAADRHRAGLVAEGSLGATVHLLDDGFQHHRLARDLDVLVTTPGEIPHGHVLPRGRLREPRDVASRADVLVVMGADAAAAEYEARAVGVGAACGVTRESGAPVRVGHHASADTRRSDAGDGGSSGLAAGAPVVVACGIANPQRFVNDVRSAGWDVTQTLTFADHHPYAPRDIARLAAAVSQTGAEAVLTTDKDAVRFEVLGDLPFALYRVPIRLRFDPPDGLFVWVAGALSARRAASGTAASASPASGGRRAPGEAL